MSFFDIWLRSLPVILILMTSLWIISIIFKNASIVDLFWGFGFVIVSWLFFLHSDGNDTRKILSLVLTTVWGIRLSAYLSWRNIGKGEDFRYREFRKKYGEKRYWWISFFQTFLLQGILMWLISVTLLGAQVTRTTGGLGIADYAGILIWAIGFVFEAGGDYQLARFKRNPQNNGKVLDTGFWRYTRHPNYFGDSVVWWGYGLFSVGAGNWYAVAGSALMTFLIIKISGVALLEKSLSGTKPEYREYIERTSSFFPLPRGKK